MEDMDFPRMMPPDDRMPSGRMLFRCPDDLTDEQFDLLAAAWADDAISGEALAELVSVMNANPTRKDRAESFRQIRLVPVDERWPGLKSAVRLSPALTVFRRTFIPALLAVAAMIVLVIVGPAGAKLKTVNTRNQAAETAVTAAEIPASSPIIAIAKEPNTIAGPASITQKTVTEYLEEPAEVMEVARIQPLSIAYGYASDISVAPAVNTVMASISMMDIQSLQTVQEEKNWMLRGISYIAGTVTGKEKEIDGYMIANGCITGINNLLGWDMELERVSNRSGEPVAVTFSSSLLSFTKPVNKIVP